MNGHIGSLVTLVMLVGVVQIFAPEQALARGGAAATIMGSPGYQRALEESRKRYRESYSQPYMRSPSVHPRKKWRHRSQRY